MGDKWTVSTGETSPRILLSGNDQFTVPRLPFFLPALSRARTHFRDFVELGAFFFLALSKGYIRGRVLRLYSSHFSPRTFYSIRQAAIADFSKVQEADVFLLVRRGNAAVFFSSSTGNIFRDGEDKRERELISGRERGKFAGRESALVESGS